MYEKIGIPKSVLKQFDLRDRKAIITGGAGFLGIQFAEAISEMGGTPLLIDINENQFARWSKSFRDMSKKIVLK